MKKKILSFLMTLVMTFSFIRVIPKESIGAALIGMGRAGVSPSCTLMANHLRYFLY